MRKFLMYTCIIGLLFNCSSGGDDDGGGTPEPQPKKPTAAVLVFPNQNSECTEGTNITATNSTVLFKWNAGANTDSYDVVLKNLITAETTTHSSTTNEKSIELLRATPYSWYVISKSDDVTDTANSSTWKFYNAGEGVVTYAPFPAVAVAPVDGASIATTTTVTLEWTGSDVDNDIANYDVYFAEEGTTLSDIANGITANNVSSVSVASGKSYKWYVLTTDDEGNTSNSEVFSFSVQ
ncbi:hypothetical protein SAMN05421824_0878 [Hyunsoonleella jejuensis]|uniref:Fibronectin type-III domain-containing protein n=1 Tax=Hyunsoonleella jejuensis TaxID=419940 RepID=A0A1H9CDB5_9FLAO|nr:hypothetical protein [Hyunsoonleella jejuensis]SEP99215.1 hypothetical protein SAMN05421824_0878 [Hyunsoonleella jejuensis]